MPTPKPADVDAYLAVMRSAPFILLLFVAMVSAPLEGLANDAAIADSFVAREYRSATGVKLPYRLFAPPSAKQDQELPLILYLHGRGGAGTDNRKQISGGNTLGTHIWIEPAAQDRHPAFVLAPQIPASSTWHSTSDQPSLHVAALFELLNELRSELRIDARRIYVVGQSLGGYGAWDFIARHPELFAAAIPLCGGGDANRILSARHVAVWAFHGAKDRTVPVSRSREMVAALRTVESSVRYTEYPNVGHDVWTYAFRERDLPEWMFAQRRR
jgi:predicted peptidase